MPRDELGEGERDSSHPSGVGDRARLCDECDRDRDLEGEIDRERERDRDGERERERDGVKERERNR